MKRIIAYAVLALSSAAAIAHEQTIRCFAKVAEEESLAPLREKIALAGVDKQKFEMLANQTFPTEEEKALILAWANSRSKCLKIYETLRELHEHPLARSIFEQGNMELISLAADLYAGKITYGQFAKTRIANASKYVASLNAANDQLRQQEQAAAQQDEAARRQAILGVLSNQRPYESPQIQFHPMTTEKTTTCNTIGGQMVCRTR